MRLNLTCLLVLLCFGWSQSASAQKNIAAYYDYKTELIQLERDGSLTVRAWGKGARKKAALDKAAQNALWDVLFTGFQTAPGDRPVKALVLDKNVQERKQTYFNLFFEANGDYRHFVRSVPKESAHVLGAKKTDAGLNYGVVLQIDRVGLRNKLINDEIITE